MKTLFVGFDKQTWTLSLVAQEGNRWYQAERSMDDDIEWVQGEKPDFELTPVRDILTPPRKT
jgi:hypothetical protein